MNFSSNNNACALNDSLRAQAIQPVFRNFTASWNQSSFVTARRVMSIIIIICSILDIVGNVSCLITMIRLGIKRFSTKFFFCVIAVCDLVSFPFNMAYIWTLFNYNIIPENHSRIVCKAFHFSINIMSMTSWWVLMFISIERFLLVVAPNRMRFGSQKVVAPLAVLGLEVLLISIISIFLEFRLDRCICVFYGSQLRHSIFVAQALFSYIMITGQAILSSSILLYVLWRRAKRVGGVDQRQNSNRYHLTPFKISAAIGTSQFVIMLPFYILYLEGLRGNLSNMESGLVGFVFWSAYLLFFMTFGSNFYFSFAISRQFRRTALNGISVLVRATSKIEQAPSLPQSKPSASWNH